jgi:ribosomal protein S18 acetylase RimI-like enzyme
MTVPEELDLTEDATSAAVHRVGLRSYRVEADLIGFDIPALHETQAQLRARPLRWLGCRAEGTVVAFIAWTEEPEESPKESTVDIDRLCVDPAWFRRGLASTLLRALLDRTTGNVTVSTGADNTPATTLYERAGFTRTGTIEPAPGLRIATFALQRR